jgi:prevent-host-death family protein
MVEAGVRNVKDHLSEYLRRVRAGERVLITDRGKPVAVLVGVGHADTEEAAWNLVDRGLGEWSGGKPRGASDPRRLAGRRAEEIVREDRR